MAPVLQPKSSTICSTGYLLRSWINVFNAATVPRWKWQGVLVLKGLAASRPVSIYPSRTINYRVSSRIDIKGFPWTCCPLFMCFQDHMFTWRHGIWNFCKCYPEVTWIWNQTTICELPGAYCFRNLGTTTQSQGSSLHIVYKGLLGPFWFCQVHTHVM